MVKRDLRQIVIFYEPFTFLGIFFLINQPKLYFLSLCSLQRIMLQGHIEHSITREEYPQDDVALMKTNFLPNSLKPGLGFASLALILTERKSRMLPKRKICRVGVHQHFLRTRRLEKKKLLTGQKRRLNSKLTQKIRNSAFPI